MKIVDNYLPQDYFDHLKKTILGHNFHAPHDHGPRGYACVFYAEMDPTVHGSTEFLQPSPSLDGGKGIQSIQVVEGDLVLFPCNLFHQSPPHMSDKYRTVIAFNLY